jgi:superfamily II DNA or RNA helicase/ubiquinone/menaquinone biosynthesis C-methylase UbiE
MTTLRNCQENAIETFNKNLYDNKNTTNISMCTGSGKSRVIQEITKNQDKRIIIVFPWLPLLKQFWEDKLNPHHTHNCVRYYATEGTLRCVKKIDKRMDELNEDSYLILTTYMSAPDIYSKISDTNKIDLVIHDEAHRAERTLYKESFLTIVPYIKNCTNLSATLPLEYEADYKYSLLRGIKDGVVRDFNMNLFLCTDIERNQAKTFIEIVELLKKSHPEVKLLVYTAEANTDEIQSSSVKTFLSLNAKEVEKKGWWIQGLNEETKKERDSILKDFQTPREVSILVSCKTISEGVDLKNANCMMAWDASKSPIDNIQRVGRVLRLYKNANGTIASKEKQTPSTVMIPIFLTRSKFEDCGEDRERIHKTLSDEISLNCRGNFMPFVTVCTALKSELADEDEDLFNELINMPVKVKSTQNIIECLSKYLKKEHTVVLEEMADILDDDMYEMVMDNDWDEENSAEILTALAESQNTKLIVNDGEHKSQYGNSMNVVVMEKNEKDNGYKIVKGKKADKALERMANRTDLSFSSDAKIFLGLDSLEADATENDFVLRKINAEVQPDACWEKRRNAWEEFYQKNGKTPSNSLKNKDEKILGVWATNQKTNYKKGKLYQERIDILNNTEGWVWDDFGERWNETHQLWVEFYQKNGKRPSKRKNEEEKLPTDWAFYQRRYYRNNNLSKESIEILNKTEGWIWNWDFERWNETHQKWIEFYQKNKKNPSQHSEKRLVQWSSQQKNNYKNGNLSQDRINILNQTEGWVWEDNKDERWNKTHQKWVDFYQKNKNVPSQSSENQDEKILVNWITVQKRNYNEGKLFQERIDILNQTEGWVWDDFGERWNETHQKWVEFYQKNKKTPSHHSKNEDERFLGYWEGNQKKNFKNGNLSQDRINILNQTKGWVWEVDLDERWNKTHQKWVDFYQKNKKVPSQSSENQDEKFLERWAGTQKGNYKKGKQKKNFKNGNLSQDRINILNETEGWVWDDNKEERWNETQQKWVEFYQKNKKTPSHGTKNKDEKSLGNWVKVQKRSYKTGKLSQERINILNQTDGWVWSNDDAKSVSSDVSIETINQIESVSSVSSVDLIDKIRPSKKKIRIVKKESNASKHELGELEKYHQRFKKMKAESYASKITQDEFNAYHDIADKHDARDKPGESPNDKMAELLKKFNRKSYSAIDLGCGRNRFKTRPEVNKINWTSVDAVAVDESVIEADMANLPFEEEEFDFVIMSRALWAINYQDVLKETARILKHNGTLLICEAYSRWCKKDSSGENILPQAIKDAGFEIVKEEGTIENDDYVNTWQYIVAKKI